MSAWSEDENNAVTDAYMSMLEAEISGTTYNKSEYNRIVQGATGRSRASIEFKFCNISAVLNSLGLPYVQGYKPRSNAQKSLWAAVESKASHLRVLPELAVALPGGDASMTLEQPKHADYWHTFARLWERATGGTDVAAQPDQAVDDFWPTALRPPGVEEGLSWLDSPQPSGDLPRWLFLLGGPGAGKSHATLAATAGMQLAGDPDSLMASRSYSYAGDSVDLFVINDATISSESAESPLVDDLNRLSQEALQGRERPCNLIACVNRGILIEELASVDLQGGTPQPGSQVVRWLDGDVKRDKISLWQVSQGQGESLVRSAVLVHDEVPIANLLVVSVDECSLFERRPLVSLSGDRVEAATDYELTPLAMRREIVESSMPAGDLLVRLMDCFDDVHNAEPLALDPIGANLENLKKPMVRSALYTIARSGELATSSRMTYREVWGLLVRAIVGDAPQNMPPLTLEQHLCQLQPDSSSLEADFIKIRQLADFRVHQAVFGGTEISSKDIISDPVLRIINAADPLRDALPGRAPFDPHQGWATPVAEALTSQLSEDSPLEIVMRYDQDGHLIGLVTEFDKKVDEYFVDLLNDGDLTEETRNDAVGWYGKYLTRLYAFAFGISAFRAEISTLIQACRQKDHLPDRLQEPMRTLIRPRRHMDAAPSDSLIPLYDSRTDPITGRLAVPKLAIRVGDFELRLAKENGEQSMLSINRDGKLMAKMTLDFALVREALACAGESSGVTDQVDVTAPRLERIRASRLLVKQLEGTEVRIVEGGPGHQVTVPWKAQVDR